MPSDKDKKRDKDKNKGQRNENREPGNVNEPGGVYQPQGPPTFEKVWLMFQETKSFLKEKSLETDKKWQETERFLKEKSLETERLMKEQSRETDKKWQETDKRFKETDKKIKKAFDLFTSQWGRLVESLVEGDLPRVMQERGIMVKRTVERAKSDEEKGYEFDIIAVNGDVCVVVEVKTTLRPDDITEFLRKLRHFRKWMPEYAGKDRVLGAVAYIRVHCNSDKMAEKNGLFTIRAPGKSAKIINPEGFEPKVF